MAPPPPPMAAVAPQVEYMTGSGPRFGSVSCCDLEKFLLYFFIFFQFADGERNYDQGISGSNNNSTANRADFPRSRVCHATLSWIGADESSGRYKNWICPFCLLYCFFFQYFKSNPNSAAASRIGSYSAVSVSGRVSMQTDPYSGEIISTMPTGPPPPMQTQYAMQQQHGMRFSQMPQQQQQSGGDVYHYGDGKAVFF